MCLSEILKRELVMSMGCTEPSAIAYATSYAKEQISDSESITKVVVTLSSNVLKNALCVSLPNTELNGIESIVLLALVKGKSEKKLTIFSDIQENDIKQVINLKDKINIEIKYKTDVNSLYIEIQMESKTHSCRTIIMGYHDKIYESYLDGNLIYQNLDIKTSCKKKNKFTFDDIYDYITNNLFDIKLFEEVKKYNCGIGEYGLNNQVGLNIGSCLSKLNIYNDTYKDIIAKTVSGIDSRMSGISKKVIINSGSGNQGITATIPIVEFAKANDIDYQTELQALALSHLTAIYIRSKQSRLSSSCGAVCASAGVTAGFAYMLGCTKEQIQGAVLNHLCSNFGIFCDGAKVTCSLKVATSLASALNAAHLAKKNIFINENYGVMSSSLDESLDILARIEKNLLKQLIKQ